MFMLEWFHLMENICIKYIRSIAQFWKNKTATMFFLKKPLVHSVIIFIIHSIHTMLNNKKYHLEWNDTQVLKKFSNCNNCKTIFMPNKESDFVTKSYEGILVAISILVCLFSTTEMSEKKATVFVKKLLY